MDEERRMNGYRWQHPYSLLLIASSPLSACAGDSGRGLKPGVATLPEVLATMGQPPLSWKHPGGSEQRPVRVERAGLQTHMAFIAPAGRRQRIGEGAGYGALRVEPGKSDQASVLRLLGRSQPKWTNYFQACDEPVWEWRFCDSWNHLARFDVLFDARTGMVRTAYQRQGLVGWNGVALRGLRKSPGGRSLPSAVR